MRRLLFLLTAMLLGAACSAPKYTYNFDYYDYNSGKKQTNEPQLTHDAGQVQPGQLTLDDQSLVASADAAPVIIPTLAEPPAIENLKADVEKKFSTMTKEEKREFKREMKNELKQYVKKIKKGETINAANETKAMDRDLKLAIIFAAVSLVLSLFGAANSVFWVLSVIALVVAIVFFIKWLVRQ